MSRIEVLSLYKRLLRLHQRLPKELKDVGTIYVRDEFQRHKNITDKISLQQFMTEWTMFASTLEGQLASNDQLGEDLQTHHTKYLSDQQWGQLAELYQESKKFR